MACRAYGGDPRGSEPWGVGIRAKPQNDADGGKTRTAPPYPNHAKRRGEEAGERLLQSVGHYLETHARLERLSELRDKRARAGRVTAIEHAIDTILMPKLAKCLPAYPDINVEISIDMV